MLNLFELCHIRYGNFPFLKVYFSSEIVLLIDNIMSLKIVEFWCIIITDKCIYSYDEFGCIIYHQGIGMRRNFCDRYDPLCQALREF